MKDIAIFGINGFGRETLSLIENINAHCIACGREAEYNILGFFVDNVEKGRMVNGYPTLGGIEELNSWNKDICIAIAIGSPSGRKSVFDKITNPFVSFPVLIHPSVIIQSPKSVTIGRGSIICASTILTCNIEVGEFVLLNLMCTVGHDSVLGRFSSYMPSVNISGNVSVGECTYIGTGAKVIDKVEIGSESVVGAGAVVIKSLPSHCTAVGVPARVVKRV